MRPLVAFVFVTLACLVWAPTVGAAPYLQYQVDAGRTGSTLDPGPAASIVAGEIEQAFEVTLPGFRAFAAPPLIMNGSVYVATGPAGPSINGAPAPEGGVSGLFRIDLAHADVERLVDLDAPTALASDGDRLFVATSQGISAYPMAGGHHEWTWPYEDVLAGITGQVVCAPLSTLDGRVYAACTPFVGDGGEDASATAAGVFVVALDAATGEAAWTWTNLEAAADPATPFVVDQGPVDVPGWEARGLAVGGDRVLVSTIRYQRTNSEPVLENRVWTFDAETGDRGWTMYDPGPVGSTLVVTDGPRPNLPATAVAVSGQTAYLKGWVLEARQVETGAIDWSHRFGSGVDPRVGPPTHFVANNLGIHENRVFTTEAATTYAFEVYSGDEIWAQALPDPVADWENGEGLVVAGGIIYGVTYENALVAIDARTGHVQLSHVLASNSALDQLAEYHPHTHRVMFGVGEGVLVAAAWDGRIAVFGRTAASIVPQVSVSDAYPAVGAEVTVDLAGTQPGVLDPGIEFSADWGDGVVTPWQSDPRLSHAYQSPDEREVTIRVRNGAGQTALASVALDVGGTAPASPPERTLLETAFDRENQDLTFGVLGILVAVGGGLFAFARARTRRSRLQRELAAIERAYETNRERPMDCEAALAERRAHVQGLALDGTLDEGHVALLERRIEELRRQLRLGALDDRFHFLPHGMVVRLREMLDDGVISTWEREHVMRALDDDDVLTKKQKGKVRDLVDSWFQRDAGRAVKLRETAADKAVSGGETT